MNRAQRMLLSLLTSLGFALSLGLLFAARSTGRFTLTTLTLPGVLPVAVITSAVVGIAMSPLAYWSLRAGARNLLWWGPVLWAVLAAYVVLVVPKAGAIGIYGLLLLAVAGLVFLGLRRLAP